MKRTISIIGTSGAVMLGIAGCGGSSSPAPAANASVTTAPSPGASNAAGGARGGANRQALAGIAAELPQIKTCLDAAGISTADLPTAIPTFAGRASGAPRPSFNPSDRPTARPSGGFGGAGGGRNAGLFAIFSNQADITALKACGITVPTFTGRGAGGGFGGEGAPGGPGGAGTVPNGSPATT